MAQSQSNILFFGTSAYAVPALQWLVQHELAPLFVITQPDAVVGRAKTITAPAVKMAAQALGLTVVQPESLKDSEFKTRLSGTAWTVGVVAAYGRIVPPWLVNLPAKGLVNLHPSLLPKYRGPSPIQTTVANGDLTTGNTLMRVDEGMDTGPIIGQLPIPVSLRETTTSLEKKTSDAIPNLLDSFFLPYLEGNMQPVPQSETEASITLLLTRDDGKINWHDSADRIERLFRAYTPWPGIWTTWQGTTLKLLAITKEANRTLKPGQVKWHNNSLSIGCGSDALTITTLQREGKKPVTPREFINGYPAFADAHLA